MSSKFQLPDFDDMATVAQEISQLLYKKLMLEIKIKVMEENSFAIANTDPAYFVNGKPESATYIKSRYSYGGVKGEIVYFREDLAKATADLEDRKYKYELMKMKLDVYRTQSANERIANMS